MATQVRRVHNGNAPAFYARRWAHMTEAIENPTTRRVETALVDAVVARGEAEVSLDHLIIAANSSRTGVKRAMRRLEALDLARRAFRVGQTGRTLRSHYRLTMLAGGVS